MAGIFCLIGTSAFLVKNCWVKFVLVPVALSAFPQVVSQEQYKDQMTWRQPGRSPMEQNQVARTQSNGSGF